MAALPKQKVVIYVMPATPKTPHSFLGARETTLAGKRYVTGAEFLKLGITWPTPVAQDRDELVRHLGEMLAQKLGF